MTFVGKLLVIVQLVLSICFMTLAGAVFTRHQTWMESSRGWEEKFNEMNADYQKLQFEKDGVIKAQKLELAQSDNELKDSRAQLTQKVNEIEGQKIVIDTQKTQLNTQQALATISGDEAEIRRDEALRGRRINEQLNATLNISTQRIRQLEDELFNKQVETKLVHGKYNDLLETTARFRQVLVNNDLDPDATQYTKKKFPTPLVLGKVLMTKKSGRGTARERVEISIGSDDGLRKGDRLFVYRVGEQNKYLGEIKLELVGPDIAVGVVVDRAKNGVIEREDYVTTKL